MAHQNMNSVFYATTYHPIQAGSIDGTDTASHDNGVYRALIASSTGLYDPTGDPKAEGDPYCTLFVGRLARNTTEKTLYEAMSKYGQVKHVRLVRHVVTGSSRGYAFVDFENGNDMQNAYEVAQHNVIDGSSILVDYNRQRLMPGWIPRRLGGGLGGRKESGQLRFGGRDRPFRAPLRPIPTEQLIKLGIPLPPVGRYMSRFQLPPIPRRRGTSKDGARGKQKSFSRRSPVHESSAFKSQGWDETVEVEQRTESSRLGRRAVGAESGSSAQEDSSRQRSEGDAEEKSSVKLDRGYEDGKHHRKRRRHSEQEGKQPDREKSSRSSYEYSGSSSRQGDRGHEQAKEHKGSHSAQGDEQVDHESFTRSGHEHRESARHHERSRSSSRHMHRDSGHDEISTSRSRDKDRDSGHRHKGDRSTFPMESTAEHPKSPKHGSENSRHSHSKNRRNDSQTDKKDEL